MTSRKTAEPLDDPRRRDDGKSMISIGGPITVERDALERLARRRNIRNVTLFGSAARDELTPDSDIDLLLEFEPGRAPSLGGMVALKEEFSALFGGRSVDLATPSILRNPYRRRAIQREGRTLYAA